MPSSRPRLRHPSPALIVSCLALFAALGGGAYAASSVRSNTPLVWHSAPPAAGWSLYNSVYSKPQFAEDSNDVVHLRGALKHTPANTASGTTVFSLPPGYRPSHVLIIAIGTMGGAVGTVEIDPNGNVRPIGTSVGTFTSVDGVSFGAGE